jgi:hypothetical protein
MNTFTAASHFHYGCYAQVVHTICGQLGQEKMPFKLNPL